MQGNVEIFSHFYQNLTSPHHISLKYTVQLFRYLKSGYKYKNRKLNANTDNVQNNKHVKEKPTGFYKYRNTKRIHSFVEDQKILILQ